MTKGPVGRQLFRLTLPVMWGVLANMASQVIITWCVGRLGVGELSAISFAFPVVNFVMNLGIGLSAGTAAAVAQDLGRGNWGGVARLGSDALWLAGLSSAALALVGVLTIPVLFRRLSAPQSALPLITTYMRIWYAGAPFLVASIAWVGARVFGAPGVFLGICAANLLVAAAGTFWLWRTVERCLNSPVKRS